MNLTRRLVDLALAEVGVREVGGNNRGPRIVDYQKATWLAPGPWPWCAAFQCWLVREWLKDPGVRRAFGLTTDAEVEAWRPRTAGAFDFERWGRSKNQIILPESATAKAGDLVIFDFSHIGVVVTDQIGSTIESVEGNTNGKGERDSLSGDGVWRKRRARSLVKCYIRWRLSSANAGPARGSGGSPLSRAGTALRID
jgi:hypothetical protein